MLDLPIYNALITAEDEGLMVMSLVEMPATEKDWVCFKSDDKKPQQFSIENEEEHLLMGVVMLADTPIYRREGDYEYYIKFTKETLKEMAQKMLFDNTVNNIDLQHNGKLLPEGAVIMRELFIKDVEKGINPVGFEDIPDGSLMCTYKVYDDELWDDCKNGTFTGFSLEGVFSVRQEFNKISNKKNNMISKFKKALKELLVMFGSVKTDNGELEYEGDALEVGLEVMLGDEPAADGEYTAEDGTVYVIKDGKVEEIKKAEEPAEEETEAPENDENAEDSEDSKEEPAENVEAEEAEDEAEPAEEAEEPAPAEEAVEDNGVEALKAEIEALKGMIETLKAELDALKAEPAADCVVEDFEKAVNNADQLLSKSQKATIDAIRSAFGK